MDEKEFDYLNVIPLVDVMLVLLTIVLTTSTFIATGNIPIELPRASADAQTATLHPKTVTINREGRIWLDSRETDLQSLSTVLAELDRETPLTVRADKHLMLQVFVNVVDIIKQLGFKKISLLTEEKL